MYVSSYQPINSLSTQIATAAEQQSAVTEEINRSMVQIRHMVEELVLPVVHPSDLFEQNLWEQSLLAMAGSASMDVEWADAIASKLAPTGLYSPLQPDNSVIPASAPVSSRSLLCYPLSKPFDKRPPPWPTPCTCSP
jgi:hypothetical protein